MTNINEIEETEKGIAEDFPNFTKEDLAAKFARFQDDIKDFENIMKKLKRKKIKFNSSTFEIAINHLKTNETKYFEMLQDLFACEDLEEENFYLEELSFMTYNRYAVKNYVYDYETQMVKEAKQK